MKDKIMIKILVGLALTFILIFIGKYQRGDFSAEFSTKEACESAMIDMINELGSGFTSPWSFIKCYPKGDSK
jgi:hypothetical protein